MWGIVESWFPGLRQRLETEQFGIVETPADMQAESDAADEVPADVPANPPTSRPTRRRPGRPRRTCPRWARRLRSGRA